MALGQGFFGKHIQTSRADLAAVQRRDKRGLVDDAAAGGVDQDRPDFHGGELCRSDQGLVSARGVDRNDIGPGQRLVQVRRGGNVAFRPALLRKIRVIGAHGHAEAGHHPAQVAPDPPEPQQQKVAAAQVLAFQSPAPRPLAAANRSIGTQRTLGRGKDHHRGMFGHRIRIHVAADRQGDAPAAQRVGVDRIITNAVARHELQPACLGHGRGAQRLCAYQKRVGGPDLGRDAGLLRFLDIGRCQIRLLQQGPARRMQIDRHQYMRHPAFPVPACLPGCNTAPATATRKRGRFE